MPECDQTRKAQGHDWTTIGGGSWLLFEISKGRKLCIVRERLVDLSSDLR